MDEEIKHLRARLEELERQQKEEEEKKRDPFRYLRQRIRNRELQITKLEEDIQNPGKHNKQQFYDAIESVISENECDKCLLQAIESMQEELQEIRTFLCSLQKEHAKELESIDLPIIDLLSIPTPSHE